MFVWNQGGYAYFTTINVKLLIDIDIIRRSRHEHQCFKKVCTTSLVLYNKQINIFQTTRIKEQWSVSLAARRRVIWTSVKWTKTVEHQQKLFITRVQAVTILRELQRFLFPRNLYIKYHVRVSLCSNEGTLFLYVKLYFGDSPASTPLCKIIALKSALQRIAH